MTPSDYLIWLIAMAIATTAILTIGTLGAAGLLPRRHKHADGQLAPARAKVSSDQHRHREGA